MLLKAYCFKDGKLMTTSVLNQKQKEYCLGTFKQTFLLDSSEGLQVDIYPLSQIVELEKSGKSLKIEASGIKVEGLRRKKVTVDVNWLTELNTKDYYSEGEITKIKANMKAMHDFVPESSSTLVDWENEPNLNKYYSGQEIALINANKNAKNDFVPSAENPTFSFPHSIPERFNVVHNELELPHSIPKKTKEIDSMVKERYVIEIIEPIETILGE